MSQIPLKDFPSLPTNKLLAGRKQDTTLYTNMDTYPDSVSSNPAAKPVLSLSFSAFERRVSNDFTVCEVERETGKQVSCSGSPNPSISSLQISYIKISLHQKTNIYKNIHQNKNKTYKPNKTTDPQTTGHAQPSSPSIQATTQRGHTTSSTQHPVPHHKP